MVDEYAACYVVLTQSAKLAAVLNFSPEPQDMLYSHTYSGGVPLTGLGMSDMSVCRP